ncbi:hypothetical protein DRQ50_02020 [bacterium]|nr:MAG: hypothetical protein DRQ50_02020 [bacterium]
MMRRSALFLALSVIFLFSTANAADAPRPLTPVQGGPSIQVDASLPWAPDRVLVKFTAAGLADSHLDKPAQKAAGTLLTTGLASLDATLAEVDITRIHAAHDEMRDMNLARALGADRWYHLELGSRTDIPALAKRLATDPAVEYALPDLRAYPAVVPNDPLYANNWGHDNTAQLPDLDWGGSYEHDLPTTVGTIGFDSNADPAWGGSQGYGSSSVVIAILDSGVDSTHPDLLQVAGYDFGDDDTDPNDDSASPGHGTACAGVAAAIADNSLGAVGVAGGCSIMPLKVSDSAGNLYFSYIIDAVYHAADNGADVISMSFGAAADIYEPMDIALTYADGQGVVILAATGNENNSTISYPAVNNVVIGVGAASPCGDRKRSSSDSDEVNSGVNTDPNGYTCDGERWWGSNYGLDVQDHRGAVDIIAPTILPTTDIQGAGGYDPGDYSGFFNGTSCATPYAAGVCGLIISANPAWTPAQIRAQLVSTALDIQNVESAAGWDRYSGYGMVDAAAAVGIAPPTGPTALFGLDTSSGCAPLTVNFTDLSSGTINTWAWDFGDGGTDNVADPTHIYTVPGTYDVSLTVTGPDGSDTATTVGLVTVSGPPVASFDAAPAVITAGESVTFTDTSTGDPTAWAWDFGDGGSSSLQNQVHVYGLSGTYTVRLIATSVCGSDTSTVVDVVTVNPPPAPVADFEASSAGGCAPLLVAFNDLSTGAIDTWAWDFGDGGTATEAATAHDYTVPGIYDVQLTVTGPGGSDSKTVVGMITVDGPPTTSFTETANSVTAGDPITFTDTSMGSPSSWDWDFGDGGTSTLPEPTHIYTTAGLYTVTLVTTNACGPDTLVATDHITVAPPPAPVAGFSPDPAAGCVPLEVTFTDASAGDIDTWQWDFGDGGSDTDQNPVHTYNSTGSYDVRLIVMGAGGVDTMTIADAVVVETPVSAAFALSDTLGAPPLEVTFSDQSTGEPVTWAWDFGDGDTSDEAGPVHIYTGDGIYDVTLIVANGCSADTLIMVAAVQVSSLSAAGEMVPARFALAANYPNPFNPSTTIVYGLAKTGHARLEVFDVSGRRVATLVDTRQEAGEHRVQWEPRGLASGVYFTRFTANGQTVTRRMTLLK